MSIVLFMFQIIVMFTFVLGSLIISHALGIFTSENIVVLMKSLLTMQNGQ